MSSLLYQREKNIQLRLRGRVVNVEHLTILEIVRPSKGSVQPVFMVHADFWPLYP